MAIKTRSADKVYTYIKNGFTVLATFPGLEFLKFVNVSLDLIYKNLAWYGVIRDSLTDAQKNDLNKALNSAYKKVITNPQFTNKKELFTRSWPSIEREVKDVFQKEQLDIEEVNEQIQDILSKSSVLEADWVKRGDIDMLVMAFLGVLFQEIDSFASLNDIINNRRVMFLTNQISELRDETTTDRSRICKLEDAMTNLQSAYQFLVQNINEKDSARKYNVRRHSSNRFHYSSRSTEFLGREKEIEELLSFCGYDKNYHPLPVPQNLLKQELFKWWAVTGPGGSGKSRLCFEFGNFMEEGLEWTVCTPSDNSWDTLCKCSDNLLYNTLFILDYAEYNSGDIGRWMASLLADRYKNIRVRVLLIQRIGEIVNDIRENLKDVSNVKGRNIDAIDNVFKKDILLIQPIDRERLIEIICSYTPKAVCLNGTKKPCEISQDDAEQLCCKLENIDKNLRRPLFALALADAFHIHGMVTLEWEKEELLEKICEKEEEQLTAIINDGRFKDDYTLQQAGIDILVMATMTSGLDLKTEIESLLPEVYSDLTGSKYSYADRRAFFSLPLWPSSHCDPLEPDIFGEYFVLYRLKKEDDYERLVNPAWGKPYAMSRFVSRLLQDFQDNIDERLMDLLTKPVLPNLIRVIEKEMFRSFTKLAEVTIPNSVKSIGDWAFEYCSSLTSIIIPDSVTNIGNGAFAFCSSLTSINIPDSVIEIGRFTFGECSSLFNITIPDSITSIGISAFTFCSSLTSIIIPNSVMRISHDAFTYCSNLTSITIPDSVIYIGGWAFMGCTSLTSIIIPDSVTNIGNFLFSDCYSLTSIVIPTSVTSIGDLAFKNCFCLTSITIPDSVISIGSGVFTGCTRLTVYISKTLHERFGNSIFKPATVQVV